MGLRQNGAQTLVGSKKVLAVFFPYCLNLALPHQNLLFPLRASSMAEYFCVIKKPKVGLTKKCHVDETLKPSISLFKVSSRFRKTWKLKEQETK